jgi:hypothetical protein
MKHRLAIAGAALTLMGLGTACNPVYIGDSLMYQISGLLEARSDDELVDSNIGRGPDSTGLGTTSLRQAIRDRIGLTEPGEWLVVQEAGDHEITPAFVQWVVDTVPDNVCLAWVTPHDNPNRTVAADVAAIQNGITGQPCNRVIDWHLVDTSALTYDGLHLTEAGIALYADMVAS